jgi:YidC/Oxa1 family membrane protein insertase
MLVAANIFQPLIDVFEAVLKFFHSLGVPWGWSIVLLTIVVRALMIPLTVKQFHSMQRMQQHMPELKAIQNKYKDDKERQQQEMMKFYKENQINPLGSCLPLVAQLPVFISLYYMLRQSLREDICPQVQPYHVVNGHKVIDLAHTVPCGPHNGAEFLFINDLTNKATGAVLVILLVLYVGTQLISSLMMSSATMDKNQRYIMLFMPLVFVFIIIGFPAGVIVYWITTNTWTILQQYVLRRRLGTVGQAATAGAPSSTDAATTHARPPTAAVGNGAEPAANGDGAASGLSGLLRGRTKRAEDGEKAAVSATATTPRRPSSPPPPPPRKKKKRSGRRR